MAKKTMPRAVYEAVFARAESDASYPACEAMIRGVCVLRASHWHHRRMRSQGGGHDVVNGLAVCEACHHFFHMNPAVAYGEGWLVRSNSDPARVPVNRRGQVVQLFEDGTFTQIYGVGLARWRGPGTEEVNNGQVACGEKP